MATEREAQLLQQAAKAGITSPKELANFMAQVSEESQGLTHLEEGFRYPQGISQIPVQSAHRDGDAALETARVEAMQGKPGKLAELMYGGRNGNDQLGDGYTYRGRGYMQLTGKANYKEAGDALGVDLVKHPELAAEPQNASKIATWYWENKVPEAAHSDVRAATAAINGGYNGLDARQAEFNKWEKALTPEVMQHLARGEVALPIEPAAAGRHKVHPADSVLKQGAHGDAVRELQTNLIKLGYTDAHGHALKPDSHFGAGTQHAVETFQHDHHLTVDGKAGPETLKALQRSQTPAPNTQSAAPRLDDKNHPDHTMYQQALTAVHRLDAQNGRTPDQHSANLAAGVTVGALAYGLNKVDHVVLSDDGSKAFAVQGDLRSPAKQVANGVDTTQAVNTPIEQHSSTWQQNAQQAPAQQQMQQQIQQQAPPIQQQAGPTMVR
jgi:putative chitinase